MYHKLARGYATAYLNSLNAHPDIDEWFRGTRCTRALRSLEDSALSKKPGRVLKRLAPLIKPAFSYPAVGVWGKAFKLIMAEGMTVAHEAQVFDLSGDDTPLYQERSAFLTNLFLTEQKERCTAHLLTMANISHHALTRIMEREMATPETLAREVRSILACARNMAMTFPMTSLEEGGTYAFLIPFKDGALPVVTMEVRATGHEMDERRPVMAIRTFLEAEMITQQDQERMGGFEAAMTAVRDDGPQEDMIRWMETNARPWTLRAAAAAEAERQAEDRRKAGVETST